MDWALIAVGVFVALPAVVLFFVLRSARRWQDPPIDLDTEEARTLLWMRFSRGDPG